MPRGPAATMAERSERYATAGDTRGAILIASPPEPPCLTSRYTDALPGRTRGADHSAPWPAQAEITAPHRRGTHHARIVASAEHRIKTSATRGSAEGAVLSASPPAPLNS